MFTLSCSGSQKQQEWRNSGTLINLGLIQPFAVLSVFNKSLLGYTALGKQEFQHPPRTWNCPGLNSGCSKEGLSQGSIVVDCRNMCALHHFSHFSQAKKPPKTRKTHKQIELGLHILGVCCFYFSQHCPPPDKPKTNSIKAPRFDTGQAGADNLWTCCKYGEVCSVVAWLILWFYVRLRWMICNVLVWGAVACFCGNKHGAAARRVFAVWWCWYAKIVLLQKDFLGCMYKMNTISW